MANKDKQKRFTPKLKVKKGDLVRVIAGSYKGKEGKILQIFPEKNRAVVDNVNVARKHMKPTNENPGGIQEVSNPIHISNLMLIDPKSGEPTRVGKKLENGKLIRYSKKSGENIK